MTPNACRTSACDDCARDSALYDEALCVPCTNIPAYEAAAVAKGAAAVLIASGKLKDKT